MASADLCDHINVFGFLYTSMFWVNWMLCVLCV